jgi:uncharacterized protein YdeI (BOF family)
MEQLLFQVIRQILCIPRYEQSGLDAGSEFSDGSDSNPLDFDDDIQAAAIPQNVIVRILGEAGENNNIHKFQVDGLQTLGSVSVPVTATAAGVNAGNFGNQQVWLRGQFGDLVHEPWLLFKFTDSTETTEADVGNNDIPASWIPKDHTVMIFGKGGQDFGQYKVDTEYILVASGY